MTLHTETYLFGWCEPGQCNLSPEVAPLGEFEALPGEVGY